MDKYRYKNSAGETPPPGSPSTGWAFSDAIIQRPCPKCGCSAGFYCEVPSGRKRTAPHNARVIFTADNRRGLNPRPTELSE